MSTSVKFEGMKELTEKLDNLLSDEAVESALGKACALVERVAKQKAEKGSGDLRRSITSRIETDGNEKVGVVFTPLFYAPYVEYGTGLFAENGGGRKEVPWVYVEGGNSDGSGSKKKTVYATEEDAFAAAAFLEEKGLNAVVTYGQHPSPFLRPALYENREQIKRIIKGSVTND